MKSKRETVAQLAPRYKARFRIDIQLEIIATHTYTVDDVYQLALKIEEGLKFQASRHPNSQLGSTFSNWTASKLVITSSLKTSTNANRVNNQQTPNTMNKGGSKGGGHGHYVVVCPSKRLHLCVEEPKSKPESYSKEEETHNKGEFGEECDYYDGMTKGHSLVVRKQPTNPKYYE